MAAFHNGHIKVIRWLISSITQFPSKVEMTRYISQKRGDSDLVKRCKACMDIIMEEMSKHSIEANRAASSLLQEIDERKLQLNEKKLGKKLAATKKRERKKQQKMKEEEIKNEELAKEQEEKKVKKKNKKNKNKNKENEKTEDNSSKDEEKCESKESEPVVENKDDQKKSNKNNKKDVEKKSTNNKDQKSAKNNKNDRKKKEAANTEVNSKDKEDNPSSKKEDKASNEEIKISDKDSDKDHGIKTNLDLSTNTDTNQSLSVADTDNQDASNLDPSKFSPSSSNKQQEDDWKEVVRRQKKIIVPSNAISRVIGRAGCNIKLVRELSGAYIDIENQKNQQQQQQQIQNAQVDRQIIIKGSNESTKIASQLIQVLINDPEKDMNQILNQFGLTKPASFLLNQETPLKTVNVSSTKSTLPNALSDNNSVPSKQTTNTASLNLSKTAFVKEHQNSNNSNKTQFLKESTVSNSQLDKKDNPQQTSGQKTWNVSTDKQIDKSEETSSNELQSGTQAFGYFSPFDSMLGKVAQETIWSSKLNFANAAAAGLNVNSGGFSNANNNNSSLNNLLTNSDNSLNKQSKKTNEIKIDTLSKAPGYRGNLVLSPNFPYQQQLSNNSSLNQAISSNNFGPIGSMGVKSAPCTPPLSLTGVMNNPSFQTAQQAHSTSSTLNQNSSLFVNSLTSSPRKDSLNTSKLLNSPTKSFGNQISTNSSSFPTKINYPTTSITSNLQTNPDLYSPNSTSVSNPLTPTMQLNTNYPLTSNQSQSNFLPMPSSFSNSNLNITNQPNSNNPLGTNLQLQMSMCNY